jgi:periplasmic protein TonB
MASVTFNEANSGLEQFVTWYRERPTQLAFAVSLILHALLIVFIPGFRSVPVETPTVLTVQIVNTDPVVEKVREPEPVVRQEQPRPQPQPPVPPAIVAPAPLPRVVEQEPLRPRQVVEPQPTPMVRQPDAPVIEAVDRPRLAPAAPTERAQIQPQVLSRPELAPDQPVVPVVRQAPVTQVEVPPQQIAEVRREPRVVRQAPPPVQARPDVAPPVTQATPILTQPVETVQAPPKQAVEVRREPRAVPVTPDQPRPRLDEPPPASQPVRIAQPRPEVAAIQPAPAAPAPVERSKPQASPTLAPVDPVTPSPSAPVPLASPVVAAPAPPAPVRPVVTAVSPSVLEAYRQSVSREVMKHMRYPKTAIRRKWEGRTVVEMRVSADGTVTQVFVAESSGRKTLDDAAIAMVERSLPLPKPPNGVRTVKVPVVFRLQG